jgi:hypothetical protein
MTKAHRHPAGASRVAILFTCGLLLVMLVPAFHSHGLVLPGSSDVPLCAACSTGPSVAIVPSVLTLAPDLPVAVVELHPEWIVAQLAGHPSSSRAPPSA